MFSASKSGQISKGLPDPQFNYVTALLHGDGTNGAQNNTFLDSSSNAFTVTRNGTPTQGSFSPYGSLWSNYLNGSGNYLSCPNSSTMQFGSGNFTIEAWCYFNVAQESTIIGRYPFDNTNNEWLLQTDGGLHPFFAYSATGLNAGAITPVSGSAALSINTWYHIAVVKNGTGVTLYINGTSVSTGTISGSIYSGTTTTTIGCYAQSPYPSGYAVPNGYLSNVRVVKGSAVYTSNFTPTTQPLTAITNTSLLTCQSNRFIDNSTNNFTITPTGTPSVQRFNPFLPTYSQAYSTSVYGGSAYFNGTADYLTLPSNAAFAFGTGNFTLEAWVYLTSFNAYNEIIASRPNSSSYTSDVYSFEIDNTGSIFMYSGGFYVQSSASAIKLNTWTHVALVRSGTGSSQTVIYVNGTSTATGTITNNLTGTTCSVGALGNGNEPFYGYISDARVVKGTAVYTSNFTPPTAPLTAISGTSYLGSMTNGAIYDNAMMNDLLTVGSAQISTSVKKYGSGSLSFNGTTDYLNSNAKPITTLNGDFTIEGWFYVNATSSTYTILTIGDSKSPNNGIELTIEASSTTFLVYGNGNPFINGTSSISPNAWTFFALSRSGTNTKLFINGTQIGSTSTSITYAITGVLNIGAEFYNGSISQYFSGYLDDLRITNGYARYTSNFTPPTQALPNYGSST